MSDAPIPIHDARQGEPPELAALRQRSVMSFPAEMHETVRETVAAVRERGDDALVEYTRRLDWPAATAEGLAVPVEELHRAYDEVDADWLDALRTAIANVRRFHEQRVPESWLEDFDGLRLGERVIPLDSVGLYVPAQKAPLYSTLYMLAIPAEVAGVRRRVLTTPARRDGSVAPAMLVAAAECGLTEVYRLGGAQAVAALAYGTQTIPAVDKIVGPGPPWVILAKREVFGVVGIEALPGPSEALIVADEHADPALVAADLLSQAEHTGDNAVFLITDAPALAETVSAELSRLLETAPRAELAAQSLRECGAIILVRDTDAALALANDLAPEHLQLMVEDPLSVLPRIRHAGCVFLGAYSPVPLGDYAAGPSNVLPTDRTARMSSPVGVHDFVRRSSVVFASEQGLRDLRDCIETLAEGENLPAHADSIRRRFRS
jgi:histidinol dehydrogenase